MATVGGTSAILELGSGTSKRLSVAGFLSWVAWRSAYLTRLGTLRNRCVPFDCKAVVWICSGAECGRMRATSVVRSLVPPPPPAALLSHPQRFKHRCRAYVAFDWTVTLVSATWAARHESAGCISAEDSVCAFCK